MGGQTEAFIQASAIISIWTMLNAYINNEIDCKAMDAPNARRWRYAFPRSVRHTQTKPCSIKTRLAGSRYSLVVHLSTGPMLNKNTNEE